MDMKNFSYEVEEKPWGDLVDQVPCGEITTKGMTSFVEGFLLGVPFPALVVHCGKVVATARCWKALAAFCKEGRSLKGMRVLKPLEGCTFSQCSEVVSQILMQRMVPCIVLHQDLTPESVAWVSGLLGTTTPVFYAPPVRDCSQAPLPQEGRVTRSSGSNPDSEDGNARYDTWLWAL